MRFLLFLFIFICASCKTQTVYVTKPLTTPPAIYVVEDNVSSVKDLLTEYRRAVIKVSEWQLWYDVQVETNHYKRIYTNK